MNIRLGHRDRGQTIALAAVALISMVGMLGLVVDVGLFLMTRQELQKAADAAALAGVMDWDDGSLGDASTATQTAQAYVDRNSGLANALCLRQSVQTTFDPQVFGTVTLPDLTLAPALHLRVSCQTSLIFGRILWRADETPEFAVTVAADAQAAQGCLVNGNVVAYKYPCPVCPPQPPPPGCPPYPYGARLV